MVRYCLFAGAVLLTAMAPVPAADPAAEPQPIAAFETLKLSAEIARAGEKARDPWLMIAAARLRATAEVQPDANAAGRAEDWLARAEALGGDDPRVGSVVADLRAIGFKGRAAGPRVSQELLRGGERRSFTETFKAGRPAVVYIEGDGDTNLTLRVGAACHDIRPGDVKICSWMPTKSEQVTVEIGNSGRVQNRVVLGIN
ncbi:hypothetical protein [Sphingomonas sp.]|uniref:hypothetical protein n=1 Tax=Sphingomonas sp. TaxID=28214 RepID=UPI002DD6A182|nr:hypothetical protein [Sphingomonas sp.]